MPKGGGRFRKIPGGIRKFPLLFSRRVCYTMGVVGRRLPARCDGSFLSSHFVIGDVGSVCEQQASRLPSAAGSWKLRSKLETTHLLRNGAGYNLARCNGEAAARLLLSIFYIVKRAAYDFLPKGFAAAARLRQYRVNQDGCCGAAAWIGTENAPPACFLTCRRRKDNGNSLRAAQILRSSRAFYSQ